MYNKNAICNFRELKQPDSNVKYLKSQLRTLPSKKLIISTAIVSIVLTTLNHWSILNNKDKLRLIKLYCLIHKVYCIYSKNVSIIEVLFLCLKLFFCKMVCSSIQTNLENCDADKKWQTWMPKKYMMREGKRQNIWIEVAQIVKNNYIFWFTNQEPSKSWMMRNLLNCWPNERTIHSGSKLHMHTECLKQRRLPGR